RPRLRTARRDRPAIEQGAHASPLAPCLGRACGNHGRPLRCCPSPYGASAIRALPGSAPSPDADAAAFRSETSKRPRLVCVRLEEERLTGLQGPESAAARTPEIYLAEQLRPVREQPVPAVVRHPDKTPHPAHAGIVLHLQTVSG